MKCLTFTAPVHLEAVQWDGTIAHAEAILNWLGAGWVEIGELETHPPMPFLRIYEMANDGDLTHTQARSGDYVVRHHHGPVILLKKEYFEDLYGVYTKTSGIMKEDKVHEGCDFLPRVAACLHLEEDDYEGSDDLLLEIEQMQKHAEQFRKIADVCGVNLENDPYNSLVLNRVQEFKQTFDRCSRVENLSFGWALHWLKRGAILTRTGLQGSGVVWVHPDNAWGRGLPADTDPHLGLVTQEGLLKAGCWVPSQAEMLAENWMIVPPTMATAG